MVKLLVEVVPITARSRSFAVCTRNVISLSRRKHCRGNGHTFCVIHFCVIHPDFQWNSWSDAECHTLFYMIQSVIHAVKQSVIQLLQWRRVAYSKVQYKASFHPSIFNAPYPVEGQGRGFYFFLFLGRNFQNRGLGVRGGCGTLEITSIFCKLEKGTKKE